MDTDSMVWVQKPVRIQNSRMTPGHLQPPPNQSVTRVFFGREHPDGYSSRSSAEIQHAESFTFAVYMSHLALTHSYDDISVGYLTAV